MSEDDEIALDKLVSRLDTALWEMEMGNFSVDVAKPSLYERLLGSSTEGWTDCE